MLSDGRTATRRAVDSGFDHVVLFDLCLDFAKTPRLTLSAADPCGRGALAAALVCALLTVGIGALPGSLMSHARDAARSARLDVSGPVAQTAALDKKEESPH